MRILITGGCGFLGSNLARYGIEHGFNIGIFDNLSRVGSVENKKWLEEIGEFEFYYGDIRNILDIEKTLLNFQPDVIFHLAGQVAMTTSIQNPLLDFEINVKGTFNLLEAIRKINPKIGLIYSSTNKVYGDLGDFSYSENNKRYICNDQPNGFSERIPLNFHSPYGCSKGAADQYVLDYARIFGLKTIVFRHSSMYGGRQFATYDQGWVGWFCKQAILTRTDISHEFDISGNGKQVRDVLHADDMINLYFKAIKGIEEAQGEVFNIGGGISQSLSLLELFDILERKLNVKLNIIYNEPRLSDQKIFVADITKAKLYFGWEPKVTTDIGINKMLDWLL